MSASLRKTGSLSTPLKSAFEIGGRSGKAKSAFLWETWKLNIKLFSDNFNDIAAVSSKENKQGSAFEGWGDPERKD